MIMTILSNILHVHFCFQFFSTLSFLAHGSYQKPVGQDRLSGMSQPSVSRYIHEVVDILVEQLGQRYIKFPQNPAEILDVKNGYVSQCGQNFTYTAFCYFRFFVKYNIPGIIGCIDCTHIKIVTPKFFDLGYPANVFMNRKSFYSINCQLVSFN